jgi:hypothetical protein
MLCLSGSLSTRFLGVFVKCFVTYEVPPEFAKLVPYLAGFLLVCLSGSLTARLLGVFVNCFVTYEVPCWLA